MSVLAMDEDAAIAAVELVGRTGARNLEFGYLHDDVPVEDAAWWAKAQYQGTRVTEENHRGPVEALEALARRLLTGARCTHCGGVVTLSDDGAVAFPGLMADGSTWTEEEIRRAPLCRYRRNGDRWRRGCEMAPRRSGRRRRR